MCRNRGFTLLEMIVGAVILSVVVGLFFFLLVPALRTTTSRSVRAELGQAAALSMIKIGSALKGTVAGAIKVYPTGDIQGLALTPLGDLSPDGRQQYLGNMTVVVFEKAQRVLAIGEWAPATSADPNRWIQAPADLSAPLKNRKQLTAHVEEFQVSSTPEGAVTSPVNIRIVLVRKETTGEPERMEMATSICLRNSTN